MDAIQTINIKNWCTKIMSDQNSVLKAVKRNCSFHRAFIHHKNTYMHFKTKYRYTRKLDKTSQHLSNYLTDGMDKAPFKIVKSLIDMMD